MDPINPTAGNPEAFNATPQVPDIPQQMKQEEKKSSTNGITILSMAVFILLSLGAVAFLYYQNQQLKEMLAGYQTPVVSPTPAATTDPTADWIVYNNSKYLYEFKCPPTSVHSIELSSGSGTTKPYFQEICSENENQVRIYVYPSSHATIDADGAFIKEVLSPGEKEKVMLRGFDKAYFDQILSTFKFIEATDSAKPTATQVVCTMDAKICPDGSSVGRTGPNCEFAACPTP